MHQGRPGHKKAALVSGFSSSPAGRVETPNPVAGVLFTKVLEPGRERRPEGQSQGFRSSQHDIIFHVPMRLVKTQINVTEHLACAKQVLPLSTLKTTS